MEGKVAALASVVDGERDVYQPFVIESTVKWSLRPTTCHDVASRRSLVVLLSVRAHSLCRLAFESLA